MLRARVALHSNSEEIDSFDLHSGTPLPIVGEQIETESGRYMVTDITHKYSESNCEISEPQIIVHAEPDLDADTGT